MDWINYTLFSLGGAPVPLIDLISSVFGLTCVFLAGRNSKYNFWVGYLYTAALFLLFWNKNLYASLFLQPILILFSHKNLLLISFVPHILNPKIQFL